MWKVLVDKGYIYKGTYSGWYSVRDECFYNDSELVDGKAPTGAEVEAMVRETAEPHGLQYLPAYEFVLGNQTITIDQWVNSLDKHPNARSHRIIAEGLFAELRSSGLISGVQ